MNIPALNFETPLLNFIRKNNPIVNMTMNIPCINISDNSTEMGLINIVIPNTATMFMIFEPMTFPMTNPVSPCLAAAMDAASSGRDVPNATIDIPMTKEETPRAIAIPFAPKTKKWAPIPRPTIPDIILNTIRKLP